MINEEQRLARQKYIGGSDVAAIIGKSPYRSAIDIFDQKVFGKDNRKLTPAAIKRMDNGNKLEVLVKSYFEAEIGHCVEEVPDTIFCGDSPYLGANLDGIVWTATPKETAVVEFKTTSFHAVPKLTEAKHYGVKQVFPDYYYQVQHYMSVTKRKLSFICFLGEEKIGEFDARVASLEEGISANDLKLKYNDSPFFIFRIPWDEEEAGFTNLALKSFWENSVLNKTPPELPQFLNSDIA